MVLDSAFDSAMPTADEAPQVDLQRVLTGLRHLVGSAEPGRVFAELAAVCVPALCDEMIVDIEEAGDRRFGSAALGRQVALHHLTTTQARQLLARASDRTHRSLLEVADSILTTGALPENRTE